MVKLSNIQLQNNMSFNMENKQKQEKKIYKRQLIYLVPVHKITILELLAMKIYETLIFHF